MAGYWPSSFLACLYGPRQSRGPKTRKKKNGARPVFSHLDRTNLGRVVISENFDFKCE